jgi:hypothetical protein
LGLIFGSAAAAASAACFRSVFRFFEPGGRPPVPGLVSRLSALIAVLPKELRVNPLLFRMPGSQVPGGITSVPAALYP